MPERRERERERERESRQTPVAGAFPRSPGNRITYSLFESAREREREREGERGSGEP